MLPSRRGRKDRIKARAQAGDEVGVNYGAISIIFSNRARLTRNENLSVEILQRACTDGHQGEGKGFQMGKFQIIHLEVGA